MACQLQCLNSGKMFYDFCFYTIKRLTSDRFYESWVGKKLYFNVMSLIDFSDHSSPQLPFLWFFIYWRREWGSYSLQYSSKENKSIFFYFNSLFMIIISWNSNSENMYFAPRKKRMLSLLLQLLFLISLISLWFLCPVPFWTWTIMTLHKILSIETLSSVCPQSLYYSPFTSSLITLLAVSNVFILFCEC